MIDRLTAVQFDRRAGNGRTEPGFGLGERADGEHYELVLKLSSKCDRGVTSLAMELLCACLAGDLGLPVPQPFVVDLDIDWIDSIVDENWAADARLSSPVAFGSQRVPAGFNSWIAGTTLTEPMVATAASVLLFDAVTDNPDRRHSNPNCLQRGNEIKIIDHELCFGPLILGWRPPWQIGALQHLATPGNHIFRDALRGKNVNWGPITDAWNQLSDAAIDDYEAAIPDEWASALPFAQAATAKIRNARDHIEDCAIEIQRVLTC